MQTFLPVPSFWGSATLLDYRRLGKQRVETLQIMQALTGLRHRPEEEGGGLVEFVPRGSIRKHWVTLSWEGYEPALMEYQYYVCDEWEARGYKDNTCRRKTREIFREFLRLSDDWTIEKPPWWQDEAVFAAHRARLVEKDPLIYGRMFDEAPIEDYPLWMKERHK